MSTAQGIQHNKSYIIYKQNIYLQYNKEIYTSFIINSIGNDINYKYSNIIIEDT